ncbi:MAG: very short patch repair endonuclease [Allosphingosinicella sp.]|uniref:very short patch repair endonuclease n=1 Tax=Allosphingosinicella sp. TaxID=2823234 RepID=UPI003940F673
MTSRRRSPDIPVDAARSRIMRSVRQAHTGPELVVRKLLHAMGLRFRLQRRDLPGTPDIVLPKHRTAIFVHGCFWHRHVGCSKATMPRTRTEFWREKFDRNVERDRVNERALADAGWQVLTVWECETREAQTLSNRLCAAFGTSATGEAPRQT